jgi:hypothetical protein
MRKKKVFFLEKKNQKTSVLCRQHPVYALNTMSAATGKSFLLLSFEKEAFLVPKSDTPPPQ